LGTKANLKKKLPAYCLFWRNRRDQVSQPSSSLYLLPNLVYYSLHEFPRVLIYPVTKIKLFIRIFCKEAPKTVSEYKRNTETGAQQLLSELE